MPHSSELLKAIKDPVKLEAYLENNPQDLDAVDENSDNSILMKVTDSFLETGNENYRRSMLVLLRKGALHESWLKDSHEEIAHDLIAARKKFKDFEARSYKKTEASSKAEDVAPEASLHKKAEARLQLQDVTPENLVEAIRWHIEDGIDKAIKLLRMQCERYQSQSAENPRRDVVIVGTDHCSFESNLFFEEVKEAMKPLGKTLVFSEIGSEKLCPKERDKFVTFYNKSSSWTPYDVAFTVSLAARNEPDAAATSNSFFARRNLLLLDKGVLLDQYLDKVLVDGFQKFKSLCGDDIDLYEKVCMSHIRNLEFLTKREEMHVLMIAGALLKKDDPVNAAVNVGAMHVNNISKSLATLVPNLQIHKIHALPTPSLKYLPQPCPPHFITDPTSKKGESVDLSADRDIRTTKEQARGFVAIIKDKLKKEPAVAASKTPAAEAFKPILGEKPTKPLKIKKANEM